MNHNGKKERKHKFERTDRKSVLFNHAGSLASSNTTSLCNGGVVKGQDTGSGVNKVETTAGVWQQSGFTCSAADNFHHTQNHHAHA